MFSGEQKKGLLRDRCKKRVFDKLWGTCSEEFRNWWLNAPRDEQTRAVNDGVKRGDGGCLSNEVMAQRQMKEEVETKKAKQGAWKSQAVILEVASQMCGGEDKLRQAIARGAISGGANTVLFGIFAFFPLFFSVFWELWWAHTVLFGISAIFPVFSVFWGFLVGIASLIWQNRGNLSLFMLYFMVFGDSVA